MTLIAGREASAAAPAGRGSSASSPPRDPAGRPALRDASIDAARAACLVIVFVLHAMMVGVSVGPDGPVLENAMDGWAWFAPATWVLQVMPLFFVIGGFAGWTAWQRQRERGGGAADFVRGRIARLVRPAFALVAVVAGALGVLVLAGVPAEIVATAGFRIGQPLWFLAVYLGCTALVPVMARLHARHPLVTLLALGAGVVGVDLARATSGLEGLGFLNLAFVWLLAQQAGFLLADGRIDRMTRRARVRIAAASLAVLLVLVACGVYSPDLLMNLNPPTAALVLLGTAQLMLFSMVRPALRRWAERPAPARVIDRFGRWGMTLYLWHLPAFVALAGLLVVLDGSGILDLPVPLTDGWWGSRIAWLVAAGAATAGLVRVFARFETAAPTLAPLRRARIPVAVGVIAGILGVGTALVVGFAPLPAAISLGLLAMALAAARPPARTVGPQATRNAATTSASSRGSHR